VTETIILPRACDRSRLIERIVGFLSALPVEQAWKVEVAKHQQRRNDQQNRYLWGVVYAAFRKALPGWDADDVHEYLLGEWAGWEVIEGMGRKRMKAIRRSSRLSVQEFAEYVDFCIRKGAEHGIFVPEPEA
jgi:hypothetical protein